VDPMKRPDNQDMKTRKYFKLCTLILLQLAETADSGANSGRVGGSQGVGSSSDSLIARGTTPDANGASLEGELSAEAAEVLRVLGDDQLLGALTGVGTISGTVLPHHAHLHGALGHSFNFSLKTEMEKPFTYLKD
jgi:hypothetical protein